jgi:hypothetical protein
MNIIENIKQVRLLDGIVQYFSGGNSWKPFKNSIVNYTGSINLDLSDEGKYLRINSGSAATVTIRDLQFQVGGSVVIEQTGVGSVQIVASGVTIHGYTYTPYQYGVIQLVKVEDTVWTIIGGVESV